MRKVYLDLDRTLFRTEEVGAIWEVLEHRFENIPSEEARSNIRSYYMSNKAGRYYDMAGHVEFYGVAAADAERAILESELTDGRFEYEGVGELIGDIRGMGLEPEVLTFGADSYQRLKASLCPSLEGVEVTTTLAHKADYFKDKPEAWGTKTVLLDDKPIGKSLPEGVIFVQSVGYNRIKAPTNSQWLTVRSLGEFSVRLKRLADSSVY